MYVSTCRLLHWAPVSIWILVTMFSVLCSFMYNLAVATFALETFFFLLFEMTLITYGLSDSKSEPSWTTNTFLLRHIFSKRLSLLQLWHFLPNAGQLRLPCLLRQLPQWFCNCLGVGRSTPLNLFLLRQSCLLRVVKFASSLFCLIEFTNNSCPDISFTSCYVCSAALIISTAFFSVKSSVRSNRSGTLGARVGWGPAASCPPARPLSAALHLPLVFGCNHFRFTHTYTTSEWCHRYNIKV